MRTIKSLASGVALIGAGIMLLSACGDSSAEPRADLADDGSAGDGATAATAGRLALPSTEWPWIRYAQESYPQESFAGVARDDDSFTVYRVPIPGIDRFDAALTARYPEANVSFSDTTYPLENLDRLVEHIVFRDRTHWKNEGIDVKGAGIAAGPEVSVRVGKLRPEMAEAMRAYYSVPSIRLYVGDVIPVPAG